MESMERMERMEGNKSKIILLEVGLNCSRCHRPQRMLSRQWGYGR